VDIFRDLGAGELRPLATAATVVQFPAAAPILHEGDPGDCAYVVVRGSVQVFTVDKTGQEIVLNRLEEFACFGEQALLPGRSNRRNASVRAYEDVTLLKILKEDFQNVLSQQHRLKERLIQLGEEQVRRNLNRVTALFRSLRIGDTAAGHQEVVFPDGTVVFREGDPADCCYVILAGAAGVYSEADGSPKLLARLGEGQCFGEAALIRRAPRAATVIAEGELRAVAVDGKKFLDAYEKNAELRQYAESLQKVYLLPRRGFLTQYLGKFLDHDCVTTTYHLFDGSHATVSQVIGQDIYNMAKSGVDGAVEVVRYVDPAGGGERELQVAGGKLVGITVRGPWEQLGKVQERVLDGAPFHV
jgi:CRP-like cAMP-binding protein